MYRRGRTYYVQDKETGQQESLHTKDKTQAKRLLNAKNEGSILAGSNLQVSRAYMVASDPDMPKRTWKGIVDFILGQSTIDEAMLHLCPKIQSVVTRAKSSAPVP
jgi:hypothetical protein